MAKLLITRGLPGSGKSYWASQQEGFVVITKDDIRAELKKSGWTWSHKNEAAVIEERDKRIENLLLSGKNVISADCNFGKHEKDLEMLAVTCAAEFAVRDFTEVPLEVCLERNSKRTGDAKVPENVIKEMHAKYVSPQLKPVKVEWVEGLPTAVICDLDGTLAIHNGRSPYDTGKCETDLLNRNVDIVLAALAYDGHEVFFVSGREEKFRPETERWLTTNRWGCPLFMRPTGDNRNDAIVKNEIFDREFRGKFNIVCIFDDRDRVVQRWRDLGLTCFQVNYGAF